MSSRSEPHVQRQASCFTAAITTRKTRQPERPFLSEWHQYAAAGFLCRSGQLGPVGEDIRSGPPRVRRYLHIPPRYAALAAKAAKIPAHYLDNVQRRAKQGEGG